MGLAPGLSIQITSATIAMGTASTIRASREKKTSCARRPIQ